MIGSAAVRNVGHFISHLPKKHERRTFMELGRPKVHDYTNSKVGFDYAIDIVDESQIYITSQRRNVKLGDHVLLETNGAFERYEIKAIDHYSSPSDMWMAQLVKIVK